MRLLHYGPSDRLILTNFRGKPIPPYAILSHRWGDSEILIEDVLNKTFKYQKGGYKKLKFCAEQAAQDGLQYFWIDTCCINRWDTDELSRAIQSMFEWYRKAKRCYVFLSDVSLPVGTLFDPVSGGDWKVLFSKSAWFTRGWTLQELIAPVSVEFFTFEGQRIGDKASLDQLLHNITDIPLAALHNCDLDQFSISERRGWVKNRKTKEEEDIVYCLLGILGVSMPATYKEGRESAERRLQDEIEKSSSAPFIIPFSRNKAFVGRESQIAELKTKLFSDSKITTMLAVVGPSGTGKSQLALEIAHWTKENLHCSVFWIDAGDEDSIYRAYANIAQKLGVPDCMDDQADAKQVVERCVSELSRRQCLIIFDNAESTFVELSSSSTGVAASNLAKLIPRSKLCSVIFTSTEPDIVATTLAAHDVVYIDDLTPKSALKMLKSCLVTPIPDAAHQDAIDLLGELPSLPLAITQAAACMNAAGMTVQRYQKQLAEHKEAPQQNTDGLFKDRQLAILSLSFRTMRDKSPLAEEFLCLAACTKRKDIPLDLLGIASQPQDREDALNLLEEYALIIRRPSESALDLHKSVQYAVRKRLQAQGTLDKWIQRTILQLLLIFPRDDHISRSKWRRLLPHAQCVLSQSQSSNTREKLDLAQKCAMALYHDGRLEEAKELGMQVMQAWKGELGSKNMRTLRSMAELAFTLKEQGQFDEAEKLEFHVLETTRSLHGDHHRSTLTCMGNLAVTYGCQGRLKEAEELEVHVMKGRMDTLGIKNPWTLTSMSNLALTYRGQGRLREAAELCVQAIEVRKEVLQEDHPDTLSTMATLALIYSEQGRWKEAYVLETQVLERRKMVLGDKHPDTLDSLTTMASTFRGQGRVRLRVRADYLKRAILSHVRSLNVLHRKA